MKRISREDILGWISDLLAHNKGLPVFLGVGLILISLVLNCFSGLEGGQGVLSWLVRSDLLLHLGAIIALIGILIGDAL
jgi:hypothetical protein